MTKALYRKTYIEQRDQLSASFVENASLTFCSRFFSSEQRSRVKEKTIMVYSSFKKEACTIPLIEKLTASGASVVLPGVTGSEIIPYYCSDQSVMKAGPFGIMEPDPEKCSACEPSTIDIIIVPGIVFDKKGGRLGFGKGYYDRFLARIGKKALKIGLCYDFQLLKDDLLPTEPHDIPMDMILTENGFFNCKTHSYISR